MCRSPGAPAVTLLLTLLIAAAQTRTGTATILRLCVTYDPPTIFAVGPRLPNVGDHWVGADVANHLQGMGIDIILGIFGQLLPGDSYITTYTGGFSESLYAARMGTCDVSVNSFFTAFSRSQCTACPSVTPTTVLLEDYDWEAFACCIVFSHAYFSGGWSLMTRATDPAVINVWEIIKQKSIIQAACYATLLCFAFAHLIWICERTVYNTTDVSVAKSYLFSRKYLDGLRDGTWFASTTVMSNALHNKTIITGPGRLVAVAWVGFGMFLTAFVTSIFSATLTTQQLQSFAITTAADMSGRSLCIVSGFYEIFWDLTFPTVGVRKTVVNDLNDCYEAIRNGSIDAAFSIRETFIAYFGTGDGTGLAVTPVVARQDYALAWGPNFTQGSQINMAILNWMEDFDPITPAYNPSIAEYYGGNAGVFVYGSGFKTTSHWDMPLVISTLVILGIYVLLQGVVMLGSWAHRNYTAGDPVGAVSENGLLDSSAAPKRKHRLSFLAKVSGMLSSNIDDHESRKGSASPYNRRGGGGSGGDFGSVRGAGGGSGVMGSRTMNGSMVNGSMVFVGTRSQAGGGATSSMHGGSVVGAGSGALASPFSRVQPTGASTVSRRDVELSVSVLPAASPVSPVQISSVSSEGLLKRAQQQQLSAEVAQQQQQRLEAQREEEEAAAFPDGGSDVGTAEAGDYADRDAENEEDAMANLVDEVVKHLGDVMRTQVRTTVREAMLMQRGGVESANIRSSANGGPPLASPQAGSAYHNMTVDDLISHAVPIVNVVPRTFLPGTGGGGGSLPRAAASAFMGSSLPRGPTSGNGGSPGGGGGSLPRGAPSSGNGGSPGGGGGSLPRAGPSSGNGGSMPRNGGSGGSPSPSSSAKVAPLPRGESNMVQHLQPGALP